MATRQSDSHDLVQRAKNVGWKVVTGAGGTQKVHTPDGTVITIHTTISDVRGLKNATATLERSGLLEAEAQAQAATAKRRTTSLTRQRTDNDKALAAAQAKAEAVAASGQYARPELVDLDWYTTRHATPWMRWVLMTPAIAAHLIEHHNTNNRPKRRDTYTRRLVESGDWRLTHQGPAMDTNAQLQDGQHRLSAIALADDPDIRVPMPFFVGMDPDNYAVIDTGRPRTLSDAISRGSTDPRRGTMASACRLIYAYDTGDPYRIMSGSRNTVTTEEVVTAVYIPHRDELRECVDWARLAKKNNLRGPDAGYAAAKFIIERANGDDNLYVDAFFNGLITGVRFGTRELLDVDDPRTAARSQLLSGRITKARSEAMRVLSMVIYTWNNVAIGRTILQARPPQNPPQPLRCVPDIDGSAPPALAADVKAMREFIA